MNGGVAPRRVVVSASHTAKQLRTRAYNVSLDFLFSSFYIYLFFPSLDRVVVVVVVVVIVKNRDDYCTKNILGTPTSLKHSGRRRRFNHVERTRETHTSTAAAGTYNTRPIARDTIYVAREWIFFSFFPLRNNIWRVKKKAYFSRFRRILS